MVQAENLVVGFACGLMDQIVSCVGRENELLGIDCNTNEIEARIPLPKGLRFWAVDSGTYHGTEGEQYSTIRAAAFMGKRYLEEATQVLHGMFSTVILLLFCFTPFHLLHDGYMLQYALAVQWTVFPYFLPTSHAANLRIATARCSSMKLTSLACQYIGWKLLPHRGLCLQSRMPC